MESPIGLVLRRTDHGKLFEDGLELANSIREKGLIQRQLEFEPVTDARIVAGRPLDLDVSLRIPNNIKNQPVLHRMELRFTNK